MRAHEHALILLKQNYHIKRDQSICLKKETIIETFHPLIKPKGLQTYLANELGPSDLEL